MYNNFLNHLLHTYQLITNNTTNFKCGGIITLIITVGTMGIKVYPTNPNAHLFCPNIATDN